MWTRDKTYDTAIEGLSPDNDEFYQRHELFSEEEERIDLFNLMKLTDKALNVAQKKEKLIKLKEFKRQAAKMLDQITEVKS